MFFLMNSSLQKNFSSSDDDNSYLDISCGKVLILKLCGTRQAENNISYSKFGNNSEVRGDEVVFGEWKSL